MERDQVMQIGRLTGIKKFEGEREKFMFNMFVDFEPVKRFDIGSGMSGFRSLDK